jgi:hypothetical protein
MPLAPPCVPDVAVYAAKHPCGSCFPVVRFVEDFGDGIEDLRACVLGQTLKRSACSGTRVSAVLVPRRTVGGDSTREEVEDGEGKEGSASVAGGRL